jgi:hypothetical protein
MASWQVKKAVVGALPLLVQDEVECHQLSCQVHPVTVLVLSASSLHNLCVPIISFDLLLVRHGVAMMRDFHRFQILQIQDQVHMDAVDPFKQQAIPIGRQFLIFMHIGLET